MFNSKSMVQKSRSILQSKMNGYTKYKQQQIQSDIERIRQTKSQFMNQENVYKSPSVNLS